MECLLQQTMRDSLECISSNILTDVHGARLLFTTFPKSRSAGEKTGDALFKVLAWSVRHLMLGIFPIVREDGLDWAKKDVARATWSGKHWVSCSCASGAR